MADTEKNAKGTDYHETADSAARDAKPKADQHDPWDRREVGPDEPNFVGTRPQTEGKENFGVVSAELVAEEDPDNPGVPKVTDEARQAEEDAQRRAQADRDKA